MSHEKFSSVNTFPLYEKVGRQRCAGADSYQAYRKPICGCRACADKYILRVADRILHGETHGDPMLVKALAGNIIETLEGLK